jgi:hypothetical protein
MSSLKPNRAADHLEIYPRSRVGYPHIDRPATHQSGFTLAVDDAFGLSSSRENGPDSNPDERDAGNQF